jgi:hypothetical protein
MIERIITWFRRREYKNNIKFSMFSSLALFMTLDALDKQTEKALPHPLHEVRFKEYKLMLASLPYKTVSFGDSIMDLTREQMTSVDLNFNISGEWAEHTNQTINELYRYFTHPPKNIVIMCLGGNPMLVYENYEYIKRTTLQCLDNLRAKFPAANIIVGGCPPNYSINVLRNAIDFESLVYNWTINNRAKFISLYELFKGFLPTANWSNDGIHLTEYGAWKLNKRIGELLT